MRTRLRRRYGEGIAHTVVGELQERGLLDDAAFAVAWRQSRERSRPRSAALVRRELLSRGVDRAAADAAVADMDDTASAERVAQKEMDRCSSLEPRGGPPQTGGVPAASRLRLYGHREHRAAAPRGAGGRPMKRTVSRERPLQISAAPRPLGGTGRRRKETV